MNREKILKLRQLKVITVGWMLIGFIMTVHDHLLLNTASSLGESGEYSFFISATRNIGAGLIGALIGGSLLVFYVNVKYQDKPYAYTLLLVSISFVSIVALITLIMGMILVPYRTGHPLSDGDSIIAFQQFIKDPSHLKAALAWSFVVSITQLLLQVNSKFGQAEFWNIICGKYNRPKRENKIFMFLDMNSSTTIAEQLGDERYHELLKDFFADITTPIIENKGNIYQYVGDEVVLAWTYKDGKENIQCIKCFFEMKQRINLQKEKYLSRYGLVPTFKAGIHCGRVIAGEVGIMKRDITYSGDVLNTTSRILSMCNEFKEEIIASTEVLAEIRSLKNYITRPLGAIKLKGKRKEVMLNGLMAI